MRFHILLLSLLAVTVVAVFLASRVVTSPTEASRRRQAAAWFELAQSPDADVATKVSALRQAVARDPQNSRYRTALADMLASAGR